MNLSGGTLRAGPIVAASESVTDSDGELRRIAGMRYQPEVSDFGRDEEPAGRRDAPTGAERHPSVFVPSAHASADVAHTIGDRSSLRTRWRPYGCVAVAVSQASWPAQSRVRIREGQPPRLRFSPGQFPCQTAVEASSGPTPMGATECFTMRSEGRLPTPRAVSRVLARRSGDRLCARATVGLSDSTSGPE